MHYLNHDNAQRIADRIMEVVPHNINIMDNHGVIIASGDKTRIGTKHRGALQVLAYGSAYEVQEETPTEKPGINLPIYYDGRLEGVIGISGHSDDVMQLGRLVVTTAQLLIESEINKEESSLRENRLNNFFFEWAHRTAKEYTPAFREQAAYFHIDVDKSRVAVLIMMQKMHYTLIDPIRSMLGPDDYLFPQSLDSVTLLIADNSDIKHKLERIMGLSTSLQFAYISDPGTVASVCIQQTQQLSYIARRLQVPWRIVYAHQLYWESKFSTLPSDPIVESVKNALHKGESGDNLRLTIMHYVESSENLKAVCERLYIHRNTLNHRIDKIQSLTGLNLKNGKDMMLLYLAALQLSLQEKKKINA